MCLLFLDLEGLHMSASRCKSIKYEAEITHMCKPEHACEVTL